MADKHGGNATFFQVVHHAEEVVDLFTSQSRRGLVHEQEFDALSEGAGNSNQLLRRHWNRLHGRIEIDVDTNQVERRSGNFAVSLRVTEAPLLEHGGREGNVLCHRQVGDQREVLKDDLDALGNCVARSQCLEAFFTQENETRIWCLNATHDFDESGLT